MNISSCERSKEIYGKKDEIISRKIAGEMLLVPVTGKLANMQRIFSLSTVSGYIWEHTDGRKNVGEITKEIMAVFDIGHQEAETDLLELLDELLKNGLILRA